MNRTDTVKNFFGLAKMPFGKSVGVNELFHSSSFEEACARLEMGIENEDVVLLTGAVGSGKSSVVRHFCHTLDPNAYKSVYIAADSFKIGEIAKRALMGLQAEVPYTGSLALSRLQQLIIKLNHEKSIMPVLIVDEIQELPTTTLVSLKNLLNYNMDSETLLFLILCGQNSIHETLDYPCLEALNRRIRIRCSLGGLSLEESSTYISRQMKLCGVEQSVFSDDTKAAIFQHSKGILSTINAICFESLICAAANDKDIIEPSVLEVVLQNRRPKE